MLDRSSGIILHVSSLPGAFGVGDFGPEAYGFVDFLSDSGCKIWQILPLGPIGKGNSPYQSISVFAGERLFISPELMMEDGLLDETIMLSAIMDSGNRVDYEKSYRVKNGLLEKAFVQFEKNRSEELNNNYRYFLNEHAWWLYDYALFYVLKQNLEKPWNEWDLPLRNREENALNEIKQTYTNEVNYVLFVQFMFFRQWFKLKDYANKKGVEILGDLPLYVSHNSADVWANQHLFLLKDDGTSEWLGGVPPDYFSEDGQLWGNPVYNWMKLKDTNFQWWKARMHFNFHLYNRVRIDHVRGLEHFWAIPWDSDTAKTGKWMKAYGHELFESILNDRPDLPVVAEDLGLITDEVVELRRFFNFPGMKVLQFAFLSDSGNDHLPHNFDKDFIAYTGTHDNNTLIGWYQSVKGDEKEVVSCYYTGPAEIESSKMIEWIWGSVARIAIMPIQDLLGIGAEGRLNVPGLAKGNWAWKLKKGQLKIEFAQKLKELNTKYNR